MNFHRAEQNSTFKTQNLELPIRRIAIFRALFLGDLLCAVPALRALRRRFPQAQITLIGLAWARQVVERLPYVDRLVPFPGYQDIAEVPYEPERTRAFLAAARAEGYDLAIQMHGDGSVSNGFVAELGARISLGYRCGTDSRLTTSLPYRPDEHEVLRWLRLVGVLGAQAGDARLEYPIAPMARARAAALLAAAPALHGPLIGLHAGAKDPARRWPAERFAALADALVDRYAARIVLTGADSERPITAAVRRAMRSPALDLAGATDLCAFAAAIGAMDLLVTNDTGASHLAAASGTRSVVLFGPTRPQCWAPLDRERHRVVDALALAGPDADPAAALSGLPIEPVLEACAGALDPARDGRRVPTGRSRRPSRALRPSPTGKGAACGD